MPFSAPPHIEFGAVTPKDDHLTINIAAAVPSRTSNWRGSCAGPRCAPSSPISGRAGEPRSHGPEGLGKALPVLAGPPLLRRPLRARGRCGRAGARIQGQGGDLGGADGHARRGDHLPGRHLRGRLCAALCGREPRYHRRPTVRPGHASAGAAFGAAWPQLDPVLRAARNSRTIQEALFGAVSGYTTYRKVLRGCCVRQQFLPSCVRGSG